MSEIICKIIEQYHRDGTPCQIWVPYSDGKQMTKYTGTIIDFDGHYLVFKDKYGENITIQVTDVKRILENGGDNHDKG